MNTSKQKKSSYLNFFTIPLIFVGVLSFCIAGYWFYEVQASKNWKPITAHMQSVEVKWTHFDAHITRPSVLVKYKYAVGGQSFSGERLMFTHINNSMMSENYSQLYERLNRAKTIQVYYNPKNPSAVVIINSLTNKWFALAYFVILWNSIVFGFMFYYQKKKKQFLLIPLTIFLLGLIWRVSNLEVDTPQLIQVIENYPPNHCKFKPPFKEYVYIAINEERMDGRLSGFNEKSIIAEINILEKEMLKDSILFSTTQVDYHHQGVKDSILFELKYQAYDKCFYRLLELKHLD